MKLIDCFTELLAYTAYLAGPRQEGTTVSYDEALQRYEELCNRAKSYRAIAEPPEEEWKEGFFAVCALIDEMILCSEWEGRQRWLTSQFQHRFFNTTNAGEEFFTHLGSLGPEAARVREVYDHCLAMGFKGRYFRPDDKPQLEGITRSNLGFLRNRGLQEGIPYIFPDAYGAEKRTKPKGRLETIVFSIVVYVIPVAIFIALWFILNNILRGVFANYFN